MTAIDKIERPAATGPFEEGTTGSPLEEAVVAALVKGNHIRIQGQALGHQHGQDLIRYGVGDGEIDYFKTLCALTAFV